MSEGVLIDADPVLTPPITGIGVYTGELLSHLCSLEGNGLRWGYYYDRARRNNTQYLIPRIAPEKMKDAFDTGLGHYGVNQWFGNWVSRWLDLYIGKWGALWMDLQARALLSRGKWRLFHGTNRWLPPLPRQVKGIVTVHDLAFLRLPHTHRSAYYRERWIARTGQAVRRADCVIACSQATAMDLQEYYKIDSRRIRVVYLGVDQEEIPWADAARKAELRQRWNLPERFLLFVGTLNIRKNVLNAVKAFATINDPELGFVIVGDSAEQSEEIECYVRERQLKSRVRMFGYMEASDLDALYQLATVFVFPSLYEGFGLPVLEAMKRRVPVVTSDNSSLRELFRDCAVLVDPESPADIARGIEHVLHDDSVRAGLIEKGERTVRMYPWRKTAEQTREIYLSLL